MNTFYRRIMVAEVKKALCESQVVWLTSRMGGYAFCHALVMLVKIGNHR